MVICVYQYTIEDVIIQYSMPDDEQLSQQQLEAAIWYVKHKARLRKILLGSILVLDVIVVGYALFGAGRDLVSSPTRRAQDFELLRVNLPQSLSQSVSRPVDLQLGGVEFLQSGGVTDVLARVRNPNPEWYVRFSYTLGIGDRVERATDGFLLPGEERPVFRSFRGVGGGTVVFNLEDIEWRRINPREILDFAVFKNEHLNFEVKEVQFIPSVVEGQGRVSRASFNLVNKTAYNYAEPKFLVLLYRGSRLIGIQSTVLERFTSGQERKVEVSWIDGIGAVTNVEVLPEIDIMNPDVYMKTQ